MVKKYIKKTYNWRPFRYLVSGGSAFLTDYIFFLCLHYLIGFSSPISGAISFFSGLVVSFLLQRHWVFNSKSKELIKHQMVSYFALAGFNLGVTTYGLVVLDKIQVPAYFAKFIIMFFITIWNYILYKKVVFKQ